jgi:hypothetical protein
VFIGPASLSPSVELALALVDARFPRLTQPASGLDLQPNDLATLSFSVPIPANIEPSSYFEVTS